MVVFEKDYFVIKCFTGSKPFEDYTETLQELLRLLQAVHPDLRGDDTFYHVHNLVQEMLPSHEQIRQDVVLETLLNHTY